MRGALLFIIISYCGFCSGQSTYELYAQQGLRFNYAAYEVDGMEGFSNFYSFIFEKTEESCGMEYLVFRYGQHPSVSQYLRIEGKKVFSKYGSNCVESLLYDFGLQVGDVVESEFNVFNDMYVSARDSVEIASGEMRLRMTITDGVSTRTWIEGIGDTEVGMALVQLIAPDNVLNCVNKDGELIFKGFLFNEVLCDSLNCAYSNPEFTNINSNLKSEFNNESSFAKDYLWNFGDGTTSVESDPIHDYEEAGCYDVYLETSDTCTTLKFRKEIVNNICFDNAWKLFEPASDLEAYGIYESNGIVFLYNGNKIFRSDNSLETWDEIEVLCQDDATRSITDITMFDAYRGYLISRIYNSSTSINESIMYTNDAGYTWEIAENSLVAPGVTLNNSKGVALANGIVSMNRSNNFGKIWTVTQTDLVESDVPGIWRKSWVLHDDARFITDSLIISSGFDWKYNRDLRHIFKSFDAGLTWDTIHPPQDISGVYFFNKDEGLGYNRVGKGLFKTYDGGHTWELIDQSIDVDNIYFTDEGNGWINTKSGKTYYTDDFMETYTNVQCDPRKINSVAANDSDYIWALRGGRVVTFRPEELVDCISTKVEKVDTESVIIFPNPTSGKVNISGENLASVVVYGSTGNRLLSKDISTKKSYSFDLSEFETGIYFISFIKIDGNIDLRKIVKIR